MEKSVKALEKQLLYPNSIERQNSMELKERGSNQSILLTAISGELASVEFFGQDHRSVTEVHTIVTDERAEC